MFHSCINPQGAVLDGSIRHGRGIHTCLSGEVYKGCYRLDERHGKGLFTAADGTCYDGSWQHDKAHGCVGVCGVPACKQRHAGCS